MQFITDFADSALLLPVALCIGAGWALLGWRRGTLAWVAALAASLGATLLLKILFAGCAPAGEPFSPSGHTAAATVIYGGLAALWLRPRLGTTAAWGVATLLAALPVAITRVALHLHTPAEAATGACLGAAGIALLLARAGPVPPLPKIRLGLAAAALVLLLHGTRLNLEPNLRTAAHWLPSLCRA